MRRSLKFAIYFVLILASPTRSALASNRSLPDGLCLLLNSRGEYGHGFVVGNKVVSSAHVLERQMDRVFVTDNGRLKDITRLIQAPPLIHSQYERAGLRLAVGSAAFKTLARAPYDVGFLTLALPIQTDFDVLEYSSIPNLLDVNAEEKALGKWSVAYLKVDDQLLRDIRHGRDITQTENNVATLPDVDAIEISIDEKKNGLNVSGQTFESANALVDTSLQSRRGLSGMPLYDRLPDARLIVVGIASAIVQLPDYPAHKNGRQTIFTPLINIQSLFKSDAMLDPFGSRFCRAFHP